MDYTITTSDGQEVTGLSFREAQKLAAQLKTLNPYIDQSDGEELTGTYWHYVDNKLVRAS